jgi:hypothetical protein
VPVVLLPGKWNLGSLHSHLLGGDFVESWRKVEFSDRVDANSEDQIFTLTLVIFNS